MPVVGTDICGWPRDGVRLSFTGSHVHKDGCRLKSLNHSHAVRASGNTKTRTRSLALTSHLHGAVLAQQIFGCACLLGRTLYPDTVIAVTEARVVTYLQ